jgi:hypothetical protein
VRSVSRMTPPLAVALAIAGLISIGWVARSTRAQDGPKASPPAEKPAESSPAPTPLPQDSAPAPSADLPLPQSAPATVADSGAVAVAPSPAAPANDDPEQNARTFVERNRKEAQDELKKLRDEEKRLRTRLGRVEAGIRRWESLLVALDNSERIAPPVTSRPIPKDSTPDDLEPVRAEKPTGAIRESVPPGPLTPLTEPSPEPKPAEPKR